jgi:hypothetical protein
MFYVLAQIVWLGLKGIGYFFYYFYLYILPFLVKYIGFPLFLIGCFMALASAGSIFVSIIAAGVIYYLYMKKIYNVDPFDRSVTQ